MRSFKYTNGNDGPLYVLGLLDRSYNCFGPSFGLSKNTRVPARLLCGRNTRWLSSNCLLAYASYGTYYYPLPVHFLHHGRHLLWNSF